MCFSKKLQIRQIYIFFVNATCLLLTKYSDNLSELLMMLLLLKLYL